MDCSLIQHSNYSQNIIIFIFIVFYIFHDRYNIVWERNLPVTTELLPIYNVCFLSASMVDVLELRFRWFESRSGRILNWTHISLYAYAQCLMKKSFIKSSLISWIYTSWEWMRKRERDFPASAPAKKSKSERGMAVPLPPWVSEIAIGTKPPFLYYCGVLVIFQIHTLQSKRNENEWNENRTSMH